MDYYNNGMEIKDAVENKTVAIATYEAGGKIITEALNWYFGDTFSKNQAVEMMNKNTSNALKSIADHLENHEYTIEDAIEYMREIAEEMSAQALVVSLRDELKFDKPKE